MPRPEEEIAARGALGAERLQERDGSGTATVRERDESTREFCDHRRDKPIVAIENLGVSVESETLEVR